MVKEDVERKRETQKEKGRQKEREKLREKETEKKRGEEREKVGDTEVRGTNGNQGEEIKIETKAKK